MLPNIACAGLEETVSISAHVTNVYGRTQSDLIDMQARTSIM